MEAPIQQTQIDEGQAGITPASQATETIAQPQESISSPVEREPSTSRENVEGKPEFENARQIKNLAKMVRSLQQSFETRFSEPPSTNPQTQAQVPYQFTQEQLLANPLGTIKGMNDALKQEILATFQQQQANMQYEQARQEAWNLIKTNEIIKRDPERDDRIREILFEDDGNGNSLQEYSKSNPKHAAQLVIKEYQSRHGSQRSAPAPSKAQMASTATAQTTGSGKSTSEAEIKAIYAQIAAMPELTKDSDFMSKMNALIKKSDLEERMAIK